MPLVTKCTHPRAILASRCCRRYTFSRLPFLEKKERVSDLFHYVLGIRIFNLFLGKVLHRNNMNRILVSRTLQTLTFCCPGRR